MATKVARLNGPHSAGIFADMTIDGPEIGTLVLVVDRAKNLPNKKAMGKQNPYCAARLGKEAKKTETDKRGGQTPRWDQEIRFTVHDSPDYYTLKISVFSEDKRTDLVGEAWVNLSDVIVPGGGRNDLWQGLNCKGKYAGELRIELTYYDSRQKPEKVVDAMPVEEEVDLDLSSSRVKRRPLPKNPNVPSTTPVVIPERPPPGRARHGPRDFQMSQRPLSMLPQELTYPHSQATLMVQKPPQEVQSSPAVPSNEYMPPNTYYREASYASEPDQYMHAQEEMLRSAEFLPQLDPSSRQRDMAQVHHHSDAAIPVQRDPLISGHPAAIPHSNSAPSLPMAHVEHRGYSSGYDVVADPVEQDPRLNNYPYQSVTQRTHDIPPGWDPRDRDPYSDKQLYEDEEEQAPPPAPPVHSNSAPAVPHYSSPHGQLRQSSTSRYEPTPPRLNQQYISNSSPLQTIERSYGMPQQVHSPNHSAAGYSADSYNRGADRYGYASTPTHSSPAQTSSPYGRTPPSQQMPSRHSVSEPYITPTRPHPLSQELPRSQIPANYQQQEPNSTAFPSYGRPLQERRSWVQEAAPLIKPRAVSPNLTPTPPSERREEQPTQLHVLSAQQSSSAIRTQSQAQTFKPRSSYNIQFPVRAFESSNESPLARGGPPRTAPARKSVSPRPSLSGSSPAGTPFGPDSFNVHNPSSRGPSGPDGNPPNGRSGPIVDWDGKEIHPSDHLPVDSWAPEPEQKAPNKTYGLGRDRDFGPRTAQGVSTNTGRISKDTVINIRRRNDVTISPSAPEDAPYHPRRFQRPQPSQGGVEPLREQRNYNPAPHPYIQQEYSHSFTEGMSGAGMGRGPQYENYAPPSIPPKVPLQQITNYEQDALSREISSIDIGSSRSRPPPSATAYIPVRSHRDRNNFY